MPESIFNLSSYRDTVDFYNTSSPFIFSITVEAVSYSKSWNTGYDPNTETYGYFSTSTEKIDILSTPTVVISHIDPGVYVTTTTATVVVTGTYLNIISVPVDYKLENSTTIYRKNFPLYPGEYEKITGVYSPDLTYDNVKCVYTINSKYLLFTTTVITTTSEVVSTSSVLVDVDAEYVHIVRYKDYWIIDRMLHDMLREQPE